MTGPEHYQEAERLVAMAATHTAAAGWPLRRNRAGATGRCRESNGWRHDHRRSPRTR
jgi:hypothetical protein